MDKPIEIVRVPVTYEEKARKVPFLLFVGWTTKERREFAKALRVLKSKTEEGVEVKPTELPILAEKMRDIPESVLEEIIDFGLCKWLEMQANMVDPGV